MLQGKIPCICHCKSSHIVGLVLQEWGGSLNDGSLKWPRKPLVSGIYFYSWLREQGSDPARYQNG